MAWTEKALSGTTMNLTKTNAVKRKDQRRKKKANRVDLSVQVFTIDEVSLEWVSSRP